MEYLHCFHESLRSNSISNVCRLFIPPFFQAFFIYLFYLLLIFKRRMRINIFFFSRWNFFLFWPIKSTFWRFMCLQMSNLLIVNAIKAVSIQG